MTAPMTVSTHAIERYVERYAPGLSAEEAAAELRALAERARPQRRGYRGATVCTAERADGRTVVLVVRGGSIRTVLREAGQGDGEVVPSPEEAPSAPPPPDTLRELPVVDEAAASRRRSAEESLARWKAGARVTEREVRRAHVTLGRRYEPARPVLPSVAGALRIDGGRYGGVAIELRDADTVASIVGRLLGAMRQADEGRRERG